MNFFGNEFPPFGKHKKGASTSTNDILNFKKPKIIYLFFNYIILQWVLRLITKI